MKVCLRFIAPFLNICLKIENLSEKPRMNWFVVFVGEQISAWFVKSKAVRLVNDLNSAWLIQLFWYENPAKSRALTKITASQGNLQECHVSFLRLDWGQKGATLETEKSSLVQTFRSLQDEGFPIFHCFHILFSKLSENRPQIWPFIIMFPIKIAIFGICSIFRHSQMA